MALNGLRFPTSQPIKFYPANVEVDNAFHTYSMDDYAMQLIQPSHFRRNPFRGNQNYYYTKVQNDQWITVIFEYALGNIASFGLRFRDKDGNVYPVSPATYMNQYTIAGNVWVEDGVSTALRYVQYKFKVSDRLANAQGYYQLEVISTFIDGLSYNYLSEWLDVRNTHLNTVLIDYFNSSNDFDIYFTADPILQLRLPAYRRMATPQFEDVNYRDQNVNLKLLSSRSYRIFDLAIGFNGGISDYHVDKVRFATQCDTLKIDNKRYIKSDSGEFSVTPIQNYPLYRLDLQIEEYNPKEAGTFFVDNGLFMLRAGTYPYCVVSFVLSEGATDYDFLTSYDNGCAEIINAIDEDALIAQLNDELTSFSLTGLFVKIGNAIYFQKDTDTLTIDSVLSLTRVMWFDFDTTPTDTSQTLTIAQGAGISAVSLYRNNLTKENLIAADQYTGNFSTVIDVEPVSPADYDQYRIYLYCNDLITELEINNIAKTIVNIDGSTSPILAEFIAVGGSMNTFSTSFVANSAQNLELLKLEDFGFINIDPNIYQKIEDDDWDKLIDVQIGINNLTDEAQDDFYLKYYNEVYLPYSLINGNLNTSFSSGFTSPTAASLAARTAMITDGYTIST